MSLALAALPAAASADVSRHPLPHRHGVASLPLKITGPAANEIARIVENSSVFFAAKCQKEADSSDYTCMVASVILPEGLREPPPVKVTGPAANEIARNLKGNYISAKCEKGARSSNYTCVLRYAQVSPEVKVTGPAANEIAQFQETSFVHYFVAKCMEEADGSNNYACVLGAEPLISSSDAAAKVKVKITGPAANEIARIAKYPLRGDVPVTFTADCRKEADSSNRTCVLRVF